MIPMIATTNGHSQPLCLCYECKKPVYAHTTPHQWYEAGQLCALCEPCYQSIDTDD